MTRACWMSLAVLVLTTACNSRTTPPAATTKEPASPPPQPPAETWVTLFDGKTLGQWKITEFGGQGEVEVKDGAIQLPFGNDMTGITWTDDLPRMNYEIYIEAQRVEGSDFFCGLTFPIDKDPCSLILGGWGGSVVGLSSLDGQDAANNDTMKLITFQNGVWYKIRLKVTPGRVQAWIDDERVVDADLTGKRIGIRGEVELSKPLGIATWQTFGAIKTIKLRKL